MLYDIVKEYESLGVHRTGTDVDRSTIAWLGSQMRARGGSVSRQDFSFDFFEAKTSVFMNGEEIPSMALYYESLTTVNSRHIAVAEFANGEHGGGLDNSLEGLISDAMADGYDALVIATSGGTGGLVAINCEARLRNRIPVMLVPGRYAKALERSEIVVEYESSLEPATSCNLIGRWGAPLNDESDPPAGNSPFVITTPMSGWFTCAGERGTGIAVALHIAERLSQLKPDIPIELIVPGGHELGFYGAWQMVDTVKVAPRAVLHLGSCIASRSAVMQGVVHAEPDTFKSVATALAALGVEAGQPDEVLSPECWVGESQCWAKLGMPMVSIAGLSPVFHTPEDTAINATSPELLELAANSLLDAALALMSDTKRTE